MNSHNTIWIFEIETRKSFKLELDHDDAKKNVITKTEIYTQGQDFGLPKVIDTFEGTLNDATITRWLNHTENCLIAQSFTELQIAKVRWSSINGLPDMKPIVTRTRQHLILPSIIFKSIN